LVTPTELSLVRALLLAHKHRHKSSGDDEILLNELGKPNALVDINGQTLKNVNDLELDEITTPVAVADHGKVYTKSDNHLYFQDGAGNEQLISLRGHHYAEMYMNANAGATPIQDANDWHLLRGFIEGQVSPDWSFVDGSQLAITAYATSNGGAKTEVTCAGHGLANGEVISISGTTSYDGVWVIEQQTTNTFVIATAFVADDGASVGEHGSHLRATDPSATGKYTSAYSFSITPSNPNDVWEFAFYLNGVLCVKCHSQTKTGAVNDFQVVSSGSILDFTAGDYIHVAARNLTGGNDFTIKHANVKIAQL
jgi:hypothetical protein